jgi:hypothetical protein
MSKNAFTWHGKAIQNRMQLAKRDVLAELAQGARDEAQSRVRVDTGFARDNTLALFPNNGSIAGREEKRQSSRTGYLVWRDSAATPPLDANTSAVMCAAIYAIFIEIRFPFLYPAALASVQRFSAIAGSVGSRHNLT